MIDIACDISFFCNHLHPFQCIISILSFAERFVAATEIVPFSVFPFALFRLAGKIDFMVVAYVNWAKFSRCLWAKIHSVLEFMA